MKISAAQVRAARGLLHWSQSELAGAAGLSRPTIDRAERASVSDDAVEAIRRALEDAGVEFIAENGGGPGVRLKRLALDAIRAADWEPWQSAASEASALRAIREKWWEYSPQSTTAKGAFWVACDESQEFRVAEAEPSKSGWRYRVKPRLYTS